MSASQEKSSHCNAPHHDLGNADRSGGSAPGVIMPSEVAPPTKVDTEPQQASTQPGDGSEVHSEGKVPWKDQVLGYAKKTRGTVLGKSATKEHGEKILQGEASPTTPLASTLD